MNKQEQAIIKTEVEPMLVKAQSMKVQTHDDRDNAVKFGVSLKEFREKIEDRFHPTGNKEKAYSTYKAALDTEKQFYEPIDRAMNIVRGEIKSFDRQEAIKAQRAAAEAEAKRQELERKEREKLEAQAKKAEEKGKVEKAEALREQAETVTVAPQFTPPPQPTKKLIWKARVTNTLLACKSIGEGLLPFNIVEFKQSALNELGKAYDGKTKVPGIEYYQDVNSRMS